MIETSKEKAARYLKKAKPDLKKTTAKVDAGRYYRIAGEEPPVDLDDLGRREHNRQVGIKRASKKLKEETELDEARKVIRKKNSVKPVIKKKSDLSREKKERMKAMRTAKKEVKQTGKKVVFQKFGDWRKIRAGAKRKIKG